MIRSNSNIPLLLMRNPSLHKHNKLIIRRATRMEHPCTKRELHLTIVSQHANACIILHAYQCLAFLTVSTGGKVDQLAVERGSVRVSSGSKQAPQL